ncbi:uncharacterized protein [Palaemon carinicauda]|uniref:uncharacterized protein n=1 Tax=Palaemon carinicauda TaxID=392227 RepID=UPI0035B69C79
MAHHGVKDPTKDKLRVVFDLKAKHTGISLNDHLMQGPYLTSSLAGVLLRFMEGQHAVTADIQEMFHQVKVSEDDRDSLRFLLWPGGDTNQAVHEFRRTSHVFGARSSPSVVNFCLRQAALDYGDKYGEEACHAIRRNFYVDNLLKSMDSEEDSFGEVSSYQLHHFVDASQTGYGVATNLPTVSKNNQVNRTLVTGRARVAPLKRPSFHEWN